LTIEQLTYIINLAVGESKFFVLIVGEANANDPEVKLASNLTLDSALKATQETVDQLRRKIN
jgi:hypothetical protein